MERSLETRKCFVHMRHGYEGRKLLLIGASVSGCKVAWIFQWMIYAKVRWSLRKSSSGRFHHSPHPEDLEKREREEIPSFLISNAPC